MSNELCQIASCGCKKRALGYCKRHYQRFKRYGDPRVTRLLRVSLSRREELIEAMFARRQITASSCWEWNGPKRGRGYGLIHVEGKIMGIHRLSAFLFLGFDTSSPLFVCHKCDNPPCFNPDHLFIGTALENMQDKERKGRSNKARGSRNGMAKLKEVDLPPIREMLARKIPQWKIASLYNVSQSAISLIHNGTNWAKGEK